MHKFGNNSPELEHLDSDPVAAKDLLIPSYLNTAAQKAGFAAGSAVKTLRELQSNQRTKILRRQTKDKAVHSR